MSILGHWISTVFCTLCVHKCEYEQ